MTTLQEAKQVSLKEKYYGKERTSREVSEEGKPSKPQTDDNETIAKNEQLGKVEINSKKAEK